MLIFYLIGVFVALLFLIYLERFYIDYVNEFRPIYLLSLASWITPLIYILLVTIYVLTQMSKEDVDKLK